VYKLEDWEQQLIDIINLHGVVDCIETFQKVGIPLMVHGCTCKEAGTCKKCVCNSGKRKCTNLCGCGNKCGYKASEELMNGTLTSSSS
jgi:hypothetical protein